MMPTVSRTRKLTAEQVRDIFIEPGNHKVIGARYGVAASTVCKIKRRVIHLEATKWMASPSKPATLNAALISMACGVVP